MKGVIPPSISITIDNNPFKKKFTENDNKQLNETIATTII